MADQPRRPRTLNDARSEAEAAFKKATTKVAEAPPKQNAVPGQPTHLHFTPTTPGNMKIKTRRQLIARQIRCIVCSWEKTEQKITSDDAFCALIDFSMASAARLDSALGAGCPP